MLYRSWEAPITLGTSSSPSVQFISAIPPSGAIGYVKDEEGNVVAIGVSEGSPSEATIRNLAESNEVGIFRPEYYNQGKYSVGYTFLIHPPIEYDTTSSHLNLKFAGASHIPYRKRQNHCTFREGRKNLCISSLPENRKDRRSICYLGECCRK